MALEVLDAAAVRRWLSQSVRLLEHHQQEVDDLNVYPVPDGDTGTNMLHTVRAAHEAVARPAADEQDARATARAAARGALLGARGNSGVILSQVFRGVAEAVDTHGALDGAGAADALARAADRAYEAVAAPVEGTILTVARAAADGASASAAAGAPLGEVVRAGTAAAADALARTPEMLPVLARAGVVDAGGRGLEVVLLALLATVEQRGAAVERVERHARRADLLTAARESGSDEYAYEVMYLLHAPDERVGALRRELTTLGDSVVVVSTGDGLASVHVHVNDVGAAIEAGIEAGRVARITVTRFEDQIAAGAPAAAASDGERALRAGRAVVAVALGDGVEALFREEGAHVVSGGATFNPSTAEILDAVRATGVDHVVVLPNEGNVLGVSRAAARIARDEGVTVAVVPSRSTVQGIAAMVARDPDRPFDAEVRAMADAVEGCAWGEVTVAVRDAETDVGPCRAGDVLGLVGGRVVLVGSDLAAVASHVVGTMMDGEDGGDLVTAVLGADAAPELAAALGDVVARRWPDAELQVIEGGQPHYPLVVGVE